MNSLSLLSNQHRPKRQSAKTRTMNIKKVVTLPVGSNLCIPQLALPTAVRNKVAKTVESREATVEEEISSKTVHPAKHENSAPPPASDLSWPALMYDRQNVFPPASSKKASSNVLSI